MRLEDMIMVSVDDHIVEPPDMFEQHLTPDWKARAPKARRTAASWFPGITTVRIFRSWTTRVRKSSKRATAYSGGLGTS